MDELMSIGRIELAESMPLGCIGPSQLKDLAYTARATHKYKAEVESLKKEVIDLRKQLESTNHSCMRVLEERVTDYNHLVNKYEATHEKLSVERKKVRALKEQLTAYTKPATDWRSE